MKPQEVEDFVLALAGTGSQQIKIAKLINFIDSGAISSGSSAASVVPRVAQVAEKKQKELARKLADEGEKIGKTTIKTDVLRRRSFGGFAQEVKSPEVLQKNVSAERFKVDFTDRRKEAGVHFTDHRICEKLTVLEPHDIERSTIDRDLSSKDKPLPHHITGATRVLNGRMQPGDLNWSKVTHASQGDFADPERSRQNAPKGHDGSYTIKVGGEERQPIQGRTCVAEKVTDPGRRPLAEKDYKNAMAERAAAKVTDAGRMTNGWASPYGEIGTDKCRPLAQKASATGKIGPVGGANYFFQ
jgi:hypothetical protein